MVFMGTKPMDLFCVYGSRLGWVCWPRARRSFTLSKIKSLFLALFFHEFFQPVNVIITIDDILGGDEFLVQGDGRF